MKVVEKKVNYVGPEEIRSFEGEYDNDFDVAPSLDESSSKQEIIDQMQSISDAHGKIEIVHKDDVKFHEIIKPAYELVLETYKSRLDGLKDSSNTK